MNVVPVAMACHTSLGYKTPCGRAFPCRTSGEKKATRRCRETVLLNGGPTGGLKPPAFSLPKEVLVDQFPEGAPLRSNAEAVANNRRLAALPRKSKSPARKWLVTLEARCPFQLKAGGFLARYHGRELLPPHRLSAPLKPQPPPRNPTTPTPATPNALT